MRIIIWICLAKTSSERAKYFRIVQDLLSKIKHQCFIVSDIRGLLTDVSGKLPTPPTSYLGSPMPPSPSTSMEGDMTDPPSPGHDSLDSMDTSSAATTTIQLPITAMTNGTRFTLCVFMLAVLAFNPFGNLLHAGMKGAMAGGDFNQQHAGGRMLMADGEMMESK